MKKRSVLLSLCAAVGLAGLLAAPSEAQAGVALGYVCYVRYTPVTTAGLGNAGFVGYSAYSGPSCTGTYLGWYLLRSTGATGGSSTDQYYLFDQPSLLAVYQSLQHAAATDQRVQISYSSTTSDWTYLIDFRAD